MRTLALICILLLAGAPSLHAQSRQTLAVDRIETVRFDEDGQARIRFDTNHPGVPGFDVFSAPADFGNVQIILPENSDAGDGADKTATAGLSITRGLIVTEGRHEVVLQATPLESGRTVEIQGRLRLDPLLDGFEPNDTYQQAQRINLPFHQIVQLSAGDLDWFRIDAPRGGIVGIHLHHTGDGYTGPGIEVLDHDGEQIFLTQDNSWSWRGMRYVRSEGRALYVGLRDQYAWSDDQTGGSYKSLEIVQYQAGLLPSGALVTLGLESEDPAFYQLGLVGEALGMPVHSADEAGAIAEELDRAVIGTAPTSTPIYLLILLGVLVLVASGGAYWWFQHRKTDDLGSAD
jgi:hypothetical protein